MLMCGITTIYRCRQSVSTPTLGITPRAQTKALGTFKSAMSIMSGNGPYKLRNSENGVDRVEVENDNAVLFCYEDPGRQDIYQVTRIILPQRKKGRRDDGLLVMDRPCDRARG